MQGDTTKLWHAMDVGAVREAVSSGESGLTTAEAEARIARLGPNRLPQARPSPWWQIALRQFRSPLVYVLGFAAGLSVAVGHAQDAGFVAIVLLLNALIGGY